MRGQDKIGAEHRSKKAYVYVRQSSMKQVMEHPESGRRQRDFAQWVQSMGWPASEVVVLDSDQGKSGQSSSEREAFKRLAGEVSSGEVGMVVSLYLSRLARNNADWFPLIEMCGLTRSLIADEEGIYDPNDPNDRLLLGLKGAGPEGDAFGGRGAADSLPASRRSVEQGAPRRTAAEAARRLRVRRARPGGDGSR